MFSNKQGVVVALGKKATDSELAAVTEKLDNHKYNHYRDSFFKLEQRAVLKGQSK